MAKISPVSIKYMIRAKLEAAGPVEKPDVIGALFGQTEGLLGRELELRELQKEGKIGRIEVETFSEGGKTTAKIQIPTSLDQSETSLIAAAIETIDRVGPTEAVITVEKIEDVRGSKRDYILERAKKLLETFDGSQNSKEMSNTLKVMSRTSKIQEYGEEALPCGDISGKEIIVVEGRADVVNLLENRITNVIGMNGTKLPKTIAELGKEKEITLFLDGDRGGRLIAKNVIENASISYIAFAPDGKEVEELNGKEILVSLRKKIPAREFSFFSKNYPYIENTNLDSSEEEHEIDKTKLNEFLKTISQTKKAYFLDEKLNVIKQVPVSKAGVALKVTKDVLIIAIDGKATPALIKAAKEANVKCIAAKTFTEASADGIEFVGF